MIKEEVEKDTTDIISELISIRTDILSYQAKMEAIKNETNEVKRDCVELALELYLNKKCHEADFYGSEKQVIRFLLQGNSKKSIDLKFPVLKQLLEIYSKVYSILGDLEQEEEKGENKDEQK